MCVLYKGVASVSQNIPLSTNIMQCTLIPNHTSVTIVVKLIAKHPHLPCTSVLPMGRIAQQRARRNCLHSSMMLVSLDFVSACLSVSLFLCTNNTIITMSCCQLVSLSVSSCLSLIGQRKEYLKITVSCMSVSTQIIPYNQSHV